MAQLTATGTPNPISNYDAVATGTVDQRVRFIVYQKYLALNGINHLEAWTDYRRLGVPSNLALSIYPGRAAQIPVRLLYPQSEYNFNAGNVSGEGTISQFTSFIFWDR
jgi:hypothetical protein